MWKPLKQGLSKIKLVEGRLTVIRSQRPGDLLVRALSVLQEISVDASFPQYLQPNNRHCLQTTALKSLAVRFNSNYIVEYTQIH